MAQIQEKERADMFTAQAVREKVDYELRQLHRRMFK